MFERTNEIKVLRDPIHGYIHVEYQVIWDCINSGEFQRLHRIHQLGGCFQVYHTAEHSRFAHSLGVYEICRRMIDEVQSLSDLLSREEKIEVLCAALLHDLGHGPYSHFFESMTSLSHETRTIRLIRNPDTEVYRALYKENPRLPEQVGLILSHRHPKEVLNQIISGQLDADRMDYLLRDAYETGTRYGTFDLERVLRTLRVKDGKLCVKESGMHSIEDYIMARYHMYWQVYLHPDAISYEVLIRMFFLRYKEFNDISLFDGLTDEELSDERFLLMDDHRFTTGLQLALDHEDPIIRDLADRILNRRLFKWIEAPDEEQEQALKEHLKKEGYDLHYYYVEQKAPVHAYLPYQEDKEPIWILTSKQETVTLSSCSQIVNALLKMDNHAQKRVYYPRTVEK